MSVSWMKKGVESSKAVEKADQEQKLKQQQNNKMWRFWLEKSEEARVTFIDGDLTPEGVLDIITFREHQIFLAGSWNNFFVCTQDVEPCPVCGSDDTPALVGVLTIIDHRVTKSKDGTKTYSNQRKLFVAKKDTIKLLQNIAAKRGGLAGATFDILRTGDRSASVGSNFDFIEKNLITDLTAKYQEEVLQPDGKTKILQSYFKPADYEKEIVYMEAKKLRELGFGPNVLGSTSAPTDTPTSGTNYADQL